MSTTKSVVLPVMSVLLSAVPVCLAEDPVLEAILKEADAVSAEVSAAENQSQGDAKAMVPIDQRLAERIRELFEEEPDFGEVRKVTSEYLEWREWPKNVDFKSRIRFQSNRSKEPTIRINYRHVRVDEQVSLYVLENSFWNTGHGGRIRPAVYALTVTEDGTAKLHRLYEPLIASTLIDTPCILGFVDSGSAMPAIAMLHGPNGTGHYCSVFLYGFSKRRDTWIQTHVARYSGSQAFRYDEDQSLLTYTVPVFDEEGNKAFREKTLSLWPLALLESVRTWNQPADRQ